jgi:hypothetical protein
MLAYDVPARVSNCLNSFCVCLLLCSFKMRCSQWNGRKGIQEMLLGPLKKWTMPLRAPAAAAAASASSPGAVTPELEAAAPLGSEGPSTSAAAAAGVAAGAGEASPPQRYSTGNSTAPAGSSSPVSVTLMEGLPRMGSVLPVVVKGSTTTSRPRSMALPVVGEWVSVKVVGLQVVQVRGRGKRGGGGGGGGGGGARAGPGCQAAAWLEID